MDQLYPCFLLTRSRGEHNAEYAQLIFVRCQEATSEPNKRSYYLTSLDEKRRSSDTACQFDVLLPSRLVPLIPLISTNVLLLICFPFKGALHSIVDLILIQLVLANAH